MQTCPTTRAGGQDDGSYRSGGGSPRDISSLGALDGGIDRDAVASVVVCRRLSSSVPPGATHPRPTRDVVDVDIDVDVDVDVDAEKLSN